MIRIKTCIHAACGFALFFLGATAQAVADEAKPAAAAPALSDEKIKKPPQVRTYTSVTVVSDPSQAPPLPSRGSPQRPESPRPDAVREPPRGDTVRELRNEIREMRQTQREIQRRGNTEPRPDAESPRSERTRPPAPERERRLEREPLRDRLIEQSR